ncbi:MAG: metal ABC transporter substrate-binding protein [Thermomicrobiales bacterium]
MVRRILALMGLTMAAAGVWPMICASGVGACQDEPVPVVASFSILADIVQQVGGDHVVITTLVTPNMDAHSFEPSLDQIVGLTDAALIFEIGIGFEPWLDRMVEAFDRTLSESWSRAAWQSAPQKPGTVMTKPTRPMITGRMIRTFGTTRSMW